MTQAITLTMNPALDLSMTIEKLRSEEKLRCAEAREDPGGGGINVARALHRLKGEVLAVFPSGGVYGGRLRELIEAEGVPCEVVPIEGRTRVNPILRERGGALYRFSLPGPELLSQHQEQCLEAVERRLERDDVFVASGSLPPGVPEDFYRQAAERAHGRGAIVLLDAKGPPLRRALEARPDWIKPNRRELAEMLEHDPGDTDALFEGARRLVGEGRVSHLFLSLGSEGGYYFGREEEASIPSPSVEVRSSSGAGDSTVAGLIHGLLQGKSPREACCWAVAAGAAAVISGGTELLRAQDFAELRDKVNVHPEVAR